MNQKIYADQFISNVCIYLSLKPSGRYQQSNREVQYSANLDLPAQNVEIVVDNSTVTLLELDR